MDLGKEDGPTRMGSEKRGSPIRRMWQGWVGPIPQRQPPFGAVPKGG
jgi:hypothetical protein